jgi:transcriptional regulator with XRE-family HTH domain
MAKSKKENIAPNTETKSHVIPDVDRNYIKKIAAKAKELRIKAGYTYEEFAAHAGLNRNTYFRFEKSSTSGDNFTIATFLRVLRGLNMTATYFFVLFER